MFIVVLMLMCYLIAFIFSLLKFLGVNNIMIFGDANPPDKKLTKLIYLFFCLVFLTAFILNLSYIIIYFMELEV
jgi:hypothetical protein